MIDVKLYEAEARLALSSLSQESAKAAVRAINHAAKRIRTEGSKRIRAQVDLPAKYVNDKLQITQYATEAKPVAAISGRIRATRLARYKAKGLTAPAPYGRTGDALRGIPAGRKHAGVAVGVKKGAKKKIKRFFLIPLQRGPKGAKQGAWIQEDEEKLFGVFLRTGKGKKDIKHLYGPSVHQLWRRVRGELTPLAMELVAREYTRLMKAKLPR